MKSLYSSINYKTNFPPPSTNTSVILSFNKMLSTLTGNKTSNIQILTIYKNKISNINNAFVTDILNAVESLLTFFINPPNSTLALSSYTLKSNTVLTLDPLYLSYLKGENVIIEDKVILSILNEIKSKNRI